MGNFLDLFPRTIYKLDGGRYSSYDTITNITFRVGIIREVMSNFAAYYEYVVKDGETPEILAEKFYDDPQAHWVILYANNIFDPQYDWPMDYRTFNAYIEAKYGSLEWPQINYHHYEKVVTRENQTDGITTVDRYIVNANTASEVYTSLLDDVPYDHWAGLEFAPVPINLQVGNKTVIETVSRNAVSYYDWEVEQNDNKRFIKVIKREYYPQIAAEFTALTNSSRVTNVRRLV